jgi:hypothetical protein
MITGANLVCDTECGLSADLGTERSYRESETVERGFVHGVPTRTEKLREGGSSRKRQANLRVL